MCVAGEICVEEQDIAFVTLVDEEPNAPIPNMMLSSATSFLSA
jgi:hypothetical protein